ncbi:MAG: hypothetical protein AUJ57_08025 [Zetaproteobacteria bacterium CG1_02_53_45]|nr:MAG: hypothetical protein AUJ57_08025 [Zetaproteobacteria bacterium CG1_02_53_45]
MITLLSLQLGFIAALFCFPASGHALGFGALELNSHLNESLKARVPLVLSGGEDVYHISVELASEAEYRQMDLPWHDRLSQIRVILEDRQSAAPVIVLSSIGVVNIPMLSIVLKATKEGRGSYYRHYRLLLDPAAMADVANALPTLAPVRLANNEASDEPGAVVVDDAAWTRIWRYGPVRGGDNLSEIAYRLRKDKRYSNKQVMLSLYEQNPDSFVDGNINQLKQGSWLTVPSGEVVKKYASADAMQKLSGLLKQSTLTVAPATSEAQVQQSAQAAPELHYSGRIKLSGAANQQMAEQILDVVKKESDEKLDAIHREMMSGKLQMDSLNKTVATLGRSVDGIQADVKSIKDDVKLLKLKAETPEKSSNEIWMIAFFVLLAATFGVILGILLRKSKESRLTEQWQETDDVQVAGKIAAEKKMIETPAVQPIVQPIANQALDAVDSQINQIEESLSQCKYEEVEGLLDRAAELAPSSLRLAVLRAQLYHETGRHEERNDLINSMSESSDKKRWESFCHMLPTHVWQACFGNEGNASE